MGAEASRPTLVASIEDVHRWHRQLADDLGSALNPNVRMQDVCVFFVRASARAIEIEQAALARKLANDGAFATRQQVLGGWKRGKLHAEIPKEAEQTKALSTEVAWPTPTLPWVAVSFKGPAYSDDQKDKPALDLISSLGFSQTSDALPEAGHQRAEG